MGKPALPLTTVPLGTPRVRQEESRRAVTQGLAPTAAHVTRGILEMAKPAPPSTIAPSEPRIARIMQPAPTLGLERTSVPATLDFKAMAPLALIATSARASVVATIVTRMPPAPTPLGATRVRAILDSMGPV